MVVDLIIIDMLDFNVILGMNFLRKYGIEINCKKKKVRFSIDNNEQFTIKKG